MAAMLLVISLVLATANTKANAATQFKDLKPGDFGYAEIIDLFERGVVTGFPGNEFQPNGKLNRAQAAVMFQRALDLPIPANKSSFTDVKAGAYYQDAVAATKAAGIFAGNPNGTFGPNDQLTREQMASLLVRVMKLESKNTSVVINDLAKIHPAHKTDVLTLYQNGVTKGKAGNNYDPKGQVTRAEFSVFVVRGVGDDLPPKKDNTTKPVEEKEKEQDKTDNNNNNPVNPPIAGGGGGGASNGGTLPDGAPLITDSTVTMTNGDVITATITGTGTSASPLRISYDLRDVPGNHTFKTGEVEVSKASTMTTTGPALFRGEVQNFSSGINVLNIARKIADQNADLANFRVLFGSSLTVRADLEDGDGVLTKIELHYRFNN